MGYGLIPVVAVIGLGVVFAVIPEPSIRAKGIVCVLVVLSLILFFRYPRFTVVATLLQVGVAVFVLLYLRYHRYGR